AEILATVDGEPIDRQRVVSLLLRGHGAALIEQLAVLQRAEARAARTGVVVMQADVDAEYDRSLQRAAASLGFESSDDTVRETDRRRTQQWLDAYLAQRNVSRAEFDLVVRINAYLRALTEHELTVDVEQLRMEFARTDGPKAEVRHIQLATLAEANRVADRLKAGESFSALAGLYSANIQSAALGGLLPAFTANDPDVPALLREAAFILKPGQVSMPIRIDPWYHLVRGERRIAATGGSFEESRAQLEHRVRERSIRPLMERLYKELLDGADIRISDPDLGDAFEHRRSD
ncbi:MAG: peptidylprolyl isomerase, partial [Planctomycetes bacterium]|nr:peptidylprolyl isomerase [Planctomycetota bacterium]